MQRPNVSQKVIIKNERGEVLVLRHPGGAHDFPGGRLEWGEELFASLQRELAEELNFQLEEEPRLFHVWNFRKESEERHSVLIYYICQLKGAVPELVSPEGLEIFWLDKEGMLQWMSDSDYVERIFAWQDPLTPPTLFYAN